MLVKAYIAGPLFSDAEKTFNQIVADRMAASGIDTYLPQRDGGEGVQMVRDGADPDTVKHDLFEADVTAVRECDVLVFLLDGRVPDEGGCFEMGMAYVLGKALFGLQTDCRRFAGNDNNLMIDFPLRSRIAHSLEELVAMLTAHLADPVDRLIPDGSPAA
jgi:nucleoside 2-deoxyribosyltransferase